MFIDFRIYRQMYRHQRAFHNVTCPIKKSYITNPPFTLKPNATMSFSNVTLFLPQKLHYPHPFLLDLYPIQPYLDRLSRGAKK